MNPQSHDAAGLPRTTRRSFCTAVALTSAGLVLAGPNTPKVFAGQGSTVAYPPLKIEGAELLLPGSSLYFTYPTRNHPAVLLRSRDGEYTAYIRRCSHAGCSVDYEPASRCLKCPCHHGTFDARYGSVMFGPPKRPLDQIILQVRAGGYVWATGTRLGSNTEVIAQSLKGGD